MCIPNKATQTDGSGLFFVTALTTSIIDCIDIHMDTQNDFS
jgi:hypothetical protein